MLFSRAEADVPCLLRSPWLLQTAGVQEELVRRNVFISAGDGFTTLSAAKTLALERQGACGNGWCEIGESAADLKGGGNPSRVSSDSSQQWSMSSHFGVCFADCPREPLPCPVLSVDKFQPPVVCGGRGVCSAAVGACRCHQGYTGLDCGRCALGYLRSPGTCCVHSYSAPSRLAPWKISPTPPCFSLPTILLVLCSSTVFISIAVATSNT